MLENAEKKFWNLDAAAAFLLGILGLAMAYLADRPHLLRSRFLGRAALVPDILGIFFALKSFDAKQTKKTLSAIGIIFSIFALLVTLLAIFDLGF